jgi:uncharacterized protein (DUF924 family)
MTADDIVDFWVAAGPRRWFTRDPAFDGTLSAKFSKTLQAARIGTYDHWATTAKGAVGLVIVLDQFSRNLNRGSPLAFAGDLMALAVAKEAVGRGFHQQLVPALGQWLIMPFEHAEDLECQHRGVGLFQSMGMLDMAHWAQVHLDIIARFGRFPHRNRVLGRSSTAAEVAFLQSGGFAG